MKAVYLGCHFRKREGRCRKYCEGRNACTTNKFIGKIVNVEATTLDNFYLIREQNDVLIRKHEVRLLSPLEELIY